MQYARRLSLENAVNLRELGGYMRNDGKITKYQQYLRSGSLGNLNHEEVEYLKNYGIKTVIDLRTLKETQREPSRLENVDGINYLHLPVFENNTPMLSESYDLGDLYLYIYENSTSIGALFNALAENADGVTLFNCTAGKDRTGLTAAIIFMIAGLDESDIVADYEVSFTYFKKAFSKQLELNPDMPMHFAHSRAEWIIEFINTLKKDHENIEKYLLSKNVTLENIETIRNKII